MNLCLSLADELSLMSDVLTLEPYSLCFFRKYLLECEFCLVNRCDELRLLLFLLSKFC